MYSAGAAVRPTSLIRGRYFQLLNFAFGRCSSSQVEKIHLGKEKFEVSKQGLGLMGFHAFYASAGKKSEKDAIDLFNKALSMGITHFDTAQFYGNKGENEAMIGKALADIPRESVQIVTKGGMSPKMAPDGRPAVIRKSIEQSLKRLGADYIDLFNLARIDTKIPIEETVEELRKLVNEGKLRHIGLSEASAKTIERANAVHPICAVQIEWSLFAREFELSVIPCCRKLQVGIVAYSPLGKGILSGAFKSNAEIPKSDFRSMVPRLSAANFEKNYKNVAKLSAMASEKGCSMGQLALAWVHHQGNDVCPIPGTTNEKHLIENVGALNTSLSSDDLKTLNKLFPVGSITGGRYPPGFPTFEDN